MDLKKIYQNVLKRLQPIDFSTIYPGFKLYKFAIYDENNVCLNGQIIDKTQEFMANTAIEYQKEFIAIWKLEEKMDYDILASKIAHEMFHAHQMKLNDQRFPNELEALYTYQYQKGNLSLKYQENILITKLIDQFSDSIFNKLLALRKKRLFKYPYEFNYETMIEEIEGTANYIELEVLKELSYEKYEVKLTKMKQRITSIDNFFPIRIISYDIGALLLKIAINELQDINLEFDDVPFPVKLMKSISSHNDTVQPINEIENAVNKYHQTTDEIIQKALNINNVVAEGNFELMGVNIYNARFLQPYIVSTFFVMYLDEGKKTVKQGNFVIELSSENKIKRIYEY